MAEDALDASDEKPVRTWYASIWEEGGADGLSFVGITHLRARSVALKVLRSIGKFGYRVKAGANIAVANQLGLRSCTRPLGVVSKLNQHTYHQPAPYGE